MSGWCQSIDQHVSTVGIRCRVHRGLSGVTNMTFKISLVMNRHSSPFISSLTCSGKYLSIRASPIAIDSHGFSSIVTWHILLMVKDLAALV